MESSFSSASTSTEEFEALREELIREQDLALQKLQAAQERKAAKEAACTASTAAEPASPIAKLKKAIALLFHWRRCPPQQPTPKPRAAVKIDPSQLIGRGGPAELKELRYYGLTPRTLALLGRLRAQERVSQQLAAELEAQKAEVRELQLCLQAAQSRIVDLEARNSQLAGQRGGRWQRHLTWGAVTKALHKCH